MRIYLAARYSRRLELCGYRSQLQEAGHEVPAVWLNGEHQIGTDGNPIGESGESLVEKCLRPGERLSQEDMSERAAALRTKFAREDFLDVVMCDVLIAFTEAPRSSSSRGGRHVEFGIALGLKKPVWIVGPRENIFHWLEDVRHFHDWESCLEFLKPVEVQ